MEKRTLVVGGIALAVVWAFSLWFAVAMGLDKNEDIAIRAVDNLEFSFNELVRCVATNERNLAYVAEVDAELHAQMLRLPVLPLAEVDR